MQRQNSGISPAFAEAVGQFLDRHSPFTDPAAWRQALRDQAWIVPHWPLSAGGQGWGPQQYFYWQNACVAAAAPLPDALTVSGAGPLLQSLDARGWAQQIDAIRTWRERWCLATPEAPGLTGQGLVLTAGANGLRLHGSIAPVVGALQSQWLLCLAERQAPTGTGLPVLLAISTATPGVTVQPLAMVGEVSAGHTGREALMATLECAEVAIDPEAVICEGAVTEQWLLRLAAWAPALSPERASVAALRRELADLTLLRQDMGDADEHDPRGADFEIRLSALEVLEHRVLAQGFGQGDSPGPTAPGLGLMLRVKSLELQQQLADAQADLLGYYLLPYADPDLSHNEPIAGPPLARERIARMLATRGLLAAHDPLGQQSGQLAALLGLGQSNQEQDLAQSLPKPPKKP